MLNLEIHSKRINNELEKTMRENEAYLAEALEGEGRYADSQGWLDTEEWADERRIRRLERLAEEIRGDADVFVLIGVGGSNNAARAVIEALKPEGGPEIIYAGNTLAPNALNKVVRMLKGKSVYINCIAKNFETLEPGAAFRILRRYMYDTYGQAARHRILATGTRGSLLESLCDDMGYTFIEFPMNIGGRYTAVTSVGLLPMAVAGIDVRKLVRGAGDMQRQLHMQEKEENIAYRYACFRNLCYRQGYRIEMLASFEPQLHFFYKWWIQLFAESEGKGNKGIFPVSGEFSEELHAVGQFLQEGCPIVFETFIEVLRQGDSRRIEPDSVKDCFDYLEGMDFHDINKTAYKATIAAHSRRIPCVTLQIGSLDAYHFGQLFYFFQFACYLSCKIMGVNAFNQKGVEAYKKCMFSALGKDTGND